MLTAFCKQGFIAIPKSAKKSRIESNLNVFDFELTEEEIAELDALDECAFLSHSGDVPDSSSDLVTDWDPVNEP